MRVGVMVGVEEGVSVFVGLGVCDGSGVSVAVGVVVGVGANVLQAVSRPTVSISRIFFIQSPFQGFDMASAPGTWTETNFPTTGGLHSVAEQAMNVRLISSSTQPFPGGSATARLNVTGPDG